MNRTTTSAMYDDISERVCMDADDGTDAAVRELRVYAGTSDLQELRHILLMQAQRCGALVEDVTSAQMPHAVKVYMRAQACCEAVCALLCAIDNEAKEASDE